MMMEREKRRQEMEQAEVNLAKSSHIPHSHHTTHCFYFQVWCCLVVQRATSFLFNSLSTVLEPFVSAIETRYLNLLIAEQGRTSAKQ